MAGWDLPDAFIDSAAAPRSSYGQCRQARVPGASTGDLPLQEVEGYGRRCGCNRQMRVKRRWYWRSSSAGRQEPRRDGVSAPRPGPRSVRKSYMSCCRRLRARPTHRKSLHRPGSQDAEDADLPAPVRQDRPQCASEGTPKRRYRFKLAELELRPTSAAWSSGAAGASPWTRASTAVDFRMKPLAQQGRLCHWWWPAASTIVPARTRQIALGTSGKPTSPFSAVRPARRDSGRLHHRRCAGPRTHRGPR